ncbi:MAG: STAS domain-containing protein [Bacteroidetes bacterium]|nr:MAG: STAS domain-containing protein [Bacteroidota bacterium]
MYGHSHYNQRSPEELLKLFSLDETDLESIRKLQAPLEERLDELVDNWYQWLKNLPEHEEFFTDPKLLEHVQKMQIKFWKIFFKAEVNDDFINMRKRMGETHARIGLPMDSFFAGVDHWLSLFIDMMGELKLKPEEYSQTRRAINKFLHMDMTIIVLSYEQLINETIAAQSKSLMEMSTPVTQIWNGILLLPVVGIIDSKRAQDIMNATLAKISETQARSFILDISGVAVVDTAVANHLIKITKATRLMGCESTISGVSPAIAQTIVELGIDVGTIKTTSNMKDALASAFNKMGLEINEIHE